MFCVETDSRRMMQVMHPPPYIRRVPVSPLNEYYRPLPHTELNTIVRLSPMRLLNTIRIDMCEILSVIPQVMHLPKPGYTAGGLMS